MLSGLQEPAPALDALLAEAREDERAKALLAHSKDYQEWIRKGREATSKAREQGRRETLDSAVSLFDLGGAPALPADAPADEDEKADDVIDASSRFMESFGEALKKKHADEDGGRVVRTGAGILTKGPKWWVSWYLPDDLYDTFEMHAPWWVTGQTFADAEERVAYTVCAALRGASEQVVKEQVLSCYDQRPEAIEWRFVNERPSSWSPFSERFPRADWMQWNDTKGSGS
jgi:hypothetical protein